MKIEAQPIQEYKLMGVDKETNKPYYRIVFVADVYKEDAIKLMNMPITEPIVMNIDEKK